MSEHHQADALLLLDDYVRRLLPAAEVDAFEEDLFARALAGDAPELKLHGDLTSAHREMKARGTLEFWLNRRQAEAVLASGARVLQFDLTADNTKVPDLSADFDLLLSRVQVDLRGLTQIDVEVCTPDGRQLKVMPEIAFDPEDEALYTCCEAELARVAISAKTVSTLWGTDRAGERRVIATIVNGTEFIRPPASL